MGFADLGRAIIRNNAKLLWKKPYLQKFGPYSEGDDESSAKKLYHKKATKEQLIHRHELTVQRNRVIWFKRLAALIIALVILVSFYLLLDYY